MSPALVALYRHGFIGPSLSSEVPGPCSGDTFHASPGKCLDCCFFPIIDWNIPLPIVTGSCNRSEVLPFSRNVFYFSCPLPRCGRATHLFSLHLLLSLIWAAGSPFVHSTIALERLVTTPLLMSFNVTEANQGPDIPFSSSPLPLDWTHFLRQHRSSSLVLQAGLGQRLDIERSTRLGWKV